MILKKLSLLIMISCCLTVIISPVNAQRRFNITVVLDSTINPEKVQYSYYDGEELYFLPDTFGTNRIVHISEKYYSPRASFHITYKDTPDEIYRNDFFIEDKPAEVSLYKQNNSDNRLNYRTIKNLVPIFDTAENEIWAGLPDFFTDSLTDEERRAFDEFAASNKDDIDSDSLASIYRSLHKKQMNVVMRYLSKYPNDYFSFWYFINQIAQPSSVLSEDKGYLKEQLEYFTIVFPSEFTESEEGKNAIEKFHSAINPVNENDTAPEFTITTIDGLLLDSKNFRGKYILLDFWATWCPPCLEDIPFLKEIRANFPEEKLSYVYFNRR